MRHGRLGTIERASYMYIGIYGLLVRVKEGVEVGSGVEEYAIFPLHYLSKWPYMLDFSRASLWSFLLQIW